MQRESIWQVVWDPTGESPRVLLDYGEVMDEELSRGVSQLTEVLRYDTAAGGIPVGRDNFKRRLKIVREVDAADPEALFADLLTAASTDPWKEKRILRISRYSGGTSYVRAAVLNVDRHPLELTANGVPGWRETISLRTNSGLTTTGPLFTIIGGWFNPPVVGGGTTSGGITIILDDDDHGLSPGDFVHVGGVTGVAPGVYPVTTVNGNQVTLDAPTNNLPRGAAGELVGGGSSGTVAFTGHLVVKGYGLSDAAAYKFSVNGGGLIDFTGSPIGGVATSGTFDLTSQINYQVWYHPSEDGPRPGGTNPLPIDGNSYPNALDPPADTSCTQTGPAEISVQLYRNGVPYGAPSTFKPSWAASKTYGAGPSTHSVPGLGTLTMTVHGPGSGGTDDPHGISGAITSGTAQKAL